jgi:hypothetical protein
LSCMLLRRAPVVLAMMVLFLPSAQALRRCWARVCTGLVRLARLGFALV